MDVIDAVPQLAENEHTFYYFNFSAYIIFFVKVLIETNVNTVELQWFEHLWDHEKMFETGVV